MGFDMSEMYSDGRYLANNPSWHEEDSPWKTNQVIRMLDRHRLDVTSVCEVGYGAGEILNRLAKHYPTKDFFGYEISPQAFELSMQKAGPNLSFRLEDLTEQDDQHFDLLMAIDVFEHIEDYIGFLRKLRPRATYKLFHIPLDLSVQTVLRSGPISNNRTNYGHLHFFTKETALATLKEADYQILDSFYTPGALELPNRGWKGRLLRAPRKLSFRVSEDLAVRVFGGYSLLVLAK
jgi:hypothetical protein